MMATCVFMAHLWLSLSESDCFIYFVECGPPRRQYQIQYLYFSRISHECNKGGAGLQAVWRDGQLVGTRPVAYGVHRRTQDRKSTRLNSSHVRISYAVFCLKKKNNE